MWRCSEKRQKRSAARMTGNRKLAGEIKTRLEHIHRKRLKGIVLYGSQVTGGATVDSDIDVLVLLQGPVHLWRDLRANIKAVYPLALRIGRPISPKPVDERLYREARCPLYRNAQRKGLEL